MGSAQSLPRVHRGCIPHHACALKISTDQDGGLDLLDALNPLASHRIPRRRHAARAATCKHSTAAGSRGSRLHCTRFELELKDICYERPQQYKVDLRVRFCAKDETARTSVPETDGGTDELEGVGLV